MITTGGWGCDRFLQVLLFGRVAKPQVWSGMVRDRASGHLTKAHPSHELSEASDIQPTGLDVV